MFKDIGTKDDVKGIAGKRNIPAVVLNNRPHLGLSIAARLDVDGSYVEAFLGEHFRLPPSPSSDLENSRLSRQVRDDFLNLVSAQGLAKGEALQSSQRLPDLVFIVGVALQGLREVELCVSSFLSCPVRSDC